METTLFADVILPVAVPNYFTYSVPEQFKKEIQPGQRVVVQFGKKKIYTAIVRNLHSNKPSEYIAKPIDGILDRSPITNEKQFTFWKWMADYYMCTEGEVMNAALPSRLKLESETRIILNSKSSVKNEDLDDDELLIAEVLEKKEVLALKEAAEIIRHKSIQPVIKSLIEKGKILIYEELKEKFKPKVEEFVRLTEFASDEKNMQKIFSELEKRAFKQLELLMEYIHLSGTKKEIKKSELLKRKDASATIIDSLVKKNVFELYNIETGRFRQEDASDKSKTLSEEQQITLEKIKNEWESKNTVLLHGVTSSGKTEIYIQLIEQTIRKGKQALYLLPEIALTTHIVTRIKKYFGDKLGVYHSRFNENERVEVWNEILDHKTANSKFQIILGARSALFLPYSNLGLVIVDEEHDSSFKQFNPAPRYHARDAAMVLAGIHHAKILLGSATPSVESYYNAKTGKYGFAELSMRYGGVQLPSVLVADVKDASKRRQMKSHFTPLLFETIEAALKNKEQIILFQNRRGFAPYLECKACGWTPQCKNCDVSLVYHKAGALLRCHYCGFAVPVPPSCKACGDTSLQMKNFGTEKIEEELQLFFPEARVGRMDLDSTRSRFSHARLLNDFMEQRIDILVGTQMVAKGLDFDNVSTVGILSAEQMLNFPDFRAHERSYQMLAQVAGRAGRKNKQGKVVIQTFSPKHSVIQHVISNDYASMYSEELLHRENFHYPPFTRLIELTVIHSDMNKTNFSAEEIGNRLKADFGSRVLGPEFPLVPRVNNLFHKKLLIKIGKDESASRVKEIIRKRIAELHNNSEFKSVRVQADVDPVG